MTKPYNSLTEDQREMLLEDAMDMREENPSFREKIAPHVQAIVEAFVAEKNGEIDELLGDYADGAAILDRFENDPLFRAETMVEAEEALRRATTHSS